MKRQSWKPFLAGAIALVFSVTIAQAQDAPEPEPLDYLEEAVNGEGTSVQMSDCDCACGECSTPARSRVAARLRPGRRTATTGCSDCGVAGGMHALVHGGIPMHSGQPLIDPAMRADWIAQQRAAYQSWHAGYYHTQWGTPVALMVPPTARMQTRMGWGVAQSTMEPLYHQFERPYPGGAGMGGEGGGMVNPLQPTPRWPSHTDQFGVYYIRGPW